MGKKDKVIQFFDPYGACGKAPGTAARTLQKKAVTSGTVNRERTVDTKTHLDPKR